MRFLHLADIHLDTAFGARSDDVRRALRQSSRDALGRGLELAAARRLDAVLIAGDLVDGERVSVQTERFLCEAFARAREAGLDIVYATGNHDPAGTELVEILRKEELARVVSTASPERLPVSRDGETIGFVTAAGHETGGVTEDLAGRFERPPGSAPEVALLHAQVVGARATASHEPYAPAELATLRSSGFDYWALGHVHARQALSESPAVHYAGNTQGRDPRESGPKGGLVATIHPTGSDCRASVEFAELADIRWETLVLDDLASIGRLPELADAIDMRWREERSSDAGIPRTHWMLRVRLSGPTALAETFASPGVATAAEEELMEALAEPLDLLDLQIDTSRARPAEAVADHVGRPDVLGEILRLAADLAEADSTPIETLAIDPVELANATGLDRASLDRYVREILEDADTSLLDAVLDRSSR